jgi:non-ribosomal peptide synthetase component F
MKINLLDYLDETAERLPDKTAFVCGDDSVAFGRLAAETDAIGTAVAELTDGGRPVLILGDKGLNIIRLYLGVLKAGCYYLPVDRDIPEARMRAIFEKADAKLVLTDDDCKEFAQGLGYPQTVRRVSELMGKGADEALLARRRAAAIDTDPAYVIFTSGSTGAPKGVVGSHRALIDYIDAITDAFGLGEDDVIGNQSPLDYIAAVRDIYLPLKNGSCTHLIDKRYFAQPERLFGYLNDHRIDTVCWVAPALSLCVDLNAFAASAPKYLKKVVFTGSALPCRHLRAWQDHVPDAVYINQ